METAMNYLPNLDPISINLGLAVGLQSEFHWTRRSLVYIKNRTGTFTMTKKAASWYF